MPSGDKGDYFPFPGAELPKFRRPLRLLRADGQQGSEFDGGSQRP